MERPGFFEYEVVEDKDLILGVRYPTALLSWEEMSS